MNAPVTPTSPFDNMSDEEVRQRMSDEFRRSDLLQMWSTGCKMAYISFGMFVFILLAIRHSLRASGSGSDDDILLYPIVVQGALFVVAIVLETVLDRMFNKLTNSPFRACGRTRLLAMTPYTELFEPSDKHDELRAKRFRVVPKSQQLDKNYQFEIVFGSKRVHMRLNGLELPGLLDVLHELQPEITRDTAPPDLVAVARIPSRFGRGRHGQP